MAEFGATEVHESTSDTAEESAVTTTEEINEPTETEDFSEEDVLSMSDEDFLKNEDKIETSTEEETEETDEEESEIPDSKEGEESDDLSDGLQDDLPDEKENVEESKESDEKPEDKQSENEDTEQTDLPSEDDLKSFYSDVMKPFKANGKEIKPESKEDIISLMQMGANYAKKMAKMKPALKVLTSLEKAQINEDELNFLIDIKNKKPEAIQKLLKDSDFDPLEYDLEKDVDYTPSNNIVSDEEATFNETIKDIQDSPHFETTKKIVTEVWDDKSRQAILSDPDLLVRLNQEFELERFDTVQSIVDRERMFGRLKGISDLEAYIQVVSNLTKEDTPAAPVQVTKPPEETKEQKPVKQQKVVKKNVDKHAAKPSPAKTKTEVKYTDDDFLNMSDEEFLRLEAKKLF